MHSHISSKRARQLTCGAEPVHFPFSPDATHPKQERHPPVTRVAVVRFLATRLVAGRLPQGSIKAATAVFGVSRGWIRGVWGKRDDAVALVTPRQPYTPRNTKITTKDAIRIITAVPLCERKTLRSLSQASGIPTTSLSRYLASHVLRRQISRVKPTLMSQQKIARLAFALGQIQRLIGARLHRFHHMYDTVHIDEKWLDMYTASSKFYLTAGEQLPYRSCASKRYIGKVMFLAAVARPRYDFGRKCAFDGKIGIWPIVETQPAKRSSANRPAGTPETKSISMTREMYVSMLKDEVFPAIRAIWPGGKSVAIRVQQDNAGPHVSEAHSGVSEAGKRDGWKIKMVCQSPQSPDMNILDLGIFNSIQYKSATTYDNASLIHVVEDAFDKVPSQVIDKCFLNLQKVLECVVKDGGGNNYALPRVSKHHICGKMLPTSLSVDANIVYNGYKVLREQI